MKSWRWFAVVFLVYFSWASRLLWAREKLGPNIVLNWDEANLAFIRQRAGHNDPIPITIRLIPGVTSADVAQLEAMVKKYNFDVSWQIWHPGEEPITAEDFQTTWLPILSQLDRGRIILGVEPNYFGTAPETYAGLLKAALAARQQGQLTIPIATGNFNLTNPSGTNPVTGAPMIPFAEYLAKVEANCSGCLARLDKIALSVYTTRPYQSGASVDEFLSQIQSAKKRLARYGVDFQKTQLVITEAGLWPSPHYPGGIQQRLRDTVLFAKELEEALKVNPEFAYLNIDQITFLVMDDATGKQYLIVKNGDGEWEVVEYPSEGGGALFSSKIRAAFGCQPQIVGQDWGLAPGQPIRIHLQTCWGDPSEPKKKLAGKLKAFSFAIPHLEQVAQSSQKTWERLRPFPYLSSPQFKTASGFVNWEVCQEGTRNWFMIYQKIKYLLPSEYHQSWFFARKLGTWLWPKVPQSKVVAVATSNPVVGNSGRRLALYPQAWVDESGRLRFKIEIVPHPGAGDITVEAFLNGEKLGLLGGPNNGRVSFGTPGSGAGWENPNFGDIILPPGTYQLTFNIVYNGPSDEGNHATTSCTIMVGPGGVSSSDCQGEAPPPPTPPICKPGSFSGQLVLSQPSCTNGVCRFYLKRPSDKFKQETISEKVIDPDTGLPQLITRTVLRPLCREVTYLARPWFQTAFLAGVETHFDRHFLIGVLRPAGVEFDRDHGLVPLRWQLTKIGGGLEEIPGIGAFFKAEAILGNLGRMVNWLTPFGGWSKIKL